MPESTNHWRAALTLGVLLILLIAGRSFAEDQLLFDFDSKTLSLEWSAVGKITARREIVPEFEPTTEQRPAERGVTVETSGEAGLFAKSGTVPGNWEQFGQISFWVYRSPDEAEQRPRSILEVQAYEPLGKARFWRKFEVDHSGWKQYSLPLRWFRWGAGTRPRWDHVDRFGFWFRDPANLSIDTVWATRGDTKKGAYFSPDELLAAAFPDAGRAAHLQETDALILLTNSATLDRAKLVEQLGNVAAAIRKDLPFLEPPVRRPRLMVFATRAEYEDFTPRFARRFNSEAQPPQSTGFTIHGIATSFWDKELGTLRPAYTHEFAHSYLAQSARIPNKTEWVHEGLASLYQLRFHPQADWREIVQQGIERDDFRSPFSDLCNGERISLNRYWQATTLLEMLLSSEAYKARLPALFQALRDARSTNLEPHLEPILNTNWDDLTSDWEKFCRAEYLSNPPKDR